MSRIVPASHQSAPDVAAPDDGAVLATRQNWTLFCLKTLIEAGQVEGHDFLSFCKRYSSQHFTAVTALTKTPRFRVNQLALEG